jgi:hypothetical protein
MVRSKRRELLMVGLGTFSGAHDDLSVFFDGGEMA